MEFFQKKENKTKNTFLKIIIKIQKYIYSLGLLYKIKNSKSNKINLILTIIYLIQFFYYINFRIDNPKNIDQIYDKISSITYSFNIENYYDNIITNIFFYSILTFIINFITIFIYFIFGGIFLKTKLFFNLYLQKFKNYDKIIFFFNFIFSINKLVLGNFYIMLFFITIIKKENINNNLNEIENIFFFISIFFNIFYYFFLIFIDSFFNKVSYQRKDILSKNSNIIFLFLDIFKIYLVFNRVYYGKFFFLNSNYIYFSKILITLFAILSTFKKTYLNFKIEKFFNLILCIYSIIALYYYLYKFLEIKLNFIFLTIFIFYYIKIHKKLKKYLYKKKILYNLKQMYQNKNLISKRKSINEILYILFNANLNYKFIEENYKDVIIEALFYQMRKSPEIFDNFKEDGKFNRKFMIDYFKINFKLYNYIYVDYINVDFYEYFTQLNYLNFLYKNFNLVYLKIHNYFSQKMNFNQFLNLLDILIDIEIEIIKENSKSSKSTLNTFDMINLYKQIENLEKHFFLFIESYQKIWQEISLNKLNYKNFQNYIEKSLKEHTIIKNLITTISRKNENNVYVLYMYGLFNKIILENKSIANEYFYKLNSIIINRKSLSDLNTGSILKFGENSDSMVIVANGEIKNIGKIINLHFNYFEFLGYEKNEIIGESINALIPNKLSIIHDQIILNYYSTAKAKLINKERLVFIVHKNGYVFPAEVFLRTSITYDFGLRFVLFLNRDVFSLKRYLPKSLFDDDLIYYLIFDDEDLICQISANFKRDFSLNKEFLDELSYFHSDKKFSLKDLLPELESDQKKNDLFRKNKQVNMKLNLNINMKENKDINNYENIVVRFFDRETAMNDQIKLNYVMMTKLTNYNKTKKVERKNLFIEKTLKNKNKKNIDKFKNGMKINNRYINDMDKPIKDDYLYKLKDNYKKKTKTKTGIFIKLILLSIFLIYTIENSYKILVTNKNNNKYIRPIKKITFDISNFFYKIYQIGSIYDDLNYFINKNNTKYEIYEDLLNSFKIQQKYISGNLTELSPAYYKNYNGLKNVELIHNWKSFSINENNVISFYNTEFLNFIQVLDSKFFYLSNLDSSKFFFAKKDFILEMKKEFNFLWINLVKQFNVYQIELFSQIYKKVKFLIINVNTNHLWLNLIVLIIHSILLIFLWLLLKKYHKSFKEIIKLFSEFDAKTSEGIFLNCQYFINTLTFINKFSIHKLEINDYYYLEENSHIKNKIKSLNEKNDITTNSSKITDNKIKKFKFKYQITKYFIAYIFILLLKMSEMGYIYFAVSYEPKLKFMEDLLNYKDIINKNYYSHYHYLIGSPINYDLQNILNSEQEMQDKIELIDVYSSKINNLHTKFNDFKTAFQIIHKDICDYREKYMKIVTEECKDKSKDNIFRKGFEFIVLSLHNNLIYERINYFGQPDVFFEKNIIEQKMLIILNESLNHFFEIYVESFKSLVSYYVFTLYLFIICQFLFFLVLFFLSSLIILNDLNKMKKQKKLFINIIPHSKIIILKNYLDK